MNRLLGISHYRAISEVLLSQNPKIKLIYNQSLPPYVELTLDKILNETGGHYEMTFEALKLLVERAWDLENEDKERNAEEEDEEY